MYEKILKKFKNFKSNFFLNYDSSKSTWFQTGGTVDIFCVVNDIKELQIILKNIDNIPCTVIGAGSNILVREAGYKGLIIKLGKTFNNLSIKDNKIIVGAGILDSNLSKFAYLNSIKNFEFFSGIPGSIGGAIKMNAGCFGSETKDFLRKVTIINKKNGEITSVKKDELQLSYRESNLRDIVLDASFDIEIGNQKKIKEKMETIKKTREATQPLKTKTSGSTFKNPKGYYAAELIENSDCKDLKVGDAIVSNKHSNFLINCGNATAGEIEELGNLIIQKVKKKFNITLQWEIHIIGDNN